MKKDHIMALQMCNIIPVIARSKEDYTPDMDSIFSHISDKTRMVVIVNPSNPTGSCIFFTFCFTVC